MTAPTPSTDPVGAVLGPEYRRPFTLLVAIVSTIAIVILGLSKATYSRRKDGEDFPNFAELTALGEGLAISPRVLQIAFGWRGVDELILLNVEEARQYLDQVGAAVFGVAEVRRYMENPERSDSPMAKAIHKLVSAVPSQPETAGKSV